MGNNCETLTIEFSDIMTDPLYDEEAVRKFHEFHPEVGPDDPMTVLQSSESGIGLSHTLVYLGKHYDITNVNIW